MERRWFLTAAGTAAGAFAAPATGALAGCLQTDGVDCSDPWSPGITGEEPTLAPGESDTVRIDVDRTTGLSLGVPELPGEDVNVEFDIASATVTPSPDIQLDSYPPQWFWERCTGVTVVIPIAVAADAEPGAYTYSVNAIQHREGGDSVDLEYVITVATE